MKRSAVGTLGIIVLLGLFAVAAKGGEGAGTGPNPMESGPIILSGPQLSSAMAQALDNLGFAYPHGTGKVYGGAGNGVIEESRNVRPSTNRRSPLLIGLYVTQCVLQGLDAQSTIRGMRSGTVREGNPLASPFASNTGALIGFKVGVAGASIFGTDRLYKHHPRLAVVILGILNAEYGYVVQHNYRIVSRH